MANTSIDEDAHKLLESCLTGSPYPQGVLDRLLEPGGNRALFRIVAEGLADLFEPRLCDAYAKLFSEVIARVLPGLNAASLLDRYGRVRKNRTFQGDPTKVENVFVLSRVTLGADIAITSILLDAARKRFENALIHFVGPQKSWELFAGDPLLHHVPAPYLRSGSLANRLAVWPDLVKALDAPNRVVIDPDSRLTQLGLLPVCPEEDYYFFESRSAGGEGNDTLPELTRDWARHTFGEIECRAFLAPLKTGGDPVDITVSLGVGENAAKRVADPFEADLLRYLSQRHSSILIDRGAGGEEAERVERAIAQSDGRIQLWDGSFAGFASHIAESDLYIGYDSAGGHVAAAGKVPMISVFGGYASERMFQRWKPWGHPAIRVIRASDPAETLRQVQEALE